MQVFEYGCGNSTLWWSERVARVFSVEHDRGWYEKVRCKVPGNVSLQFVELEYGGDYSRAVLTPGVRFDVVVIDGRDRVNAARFSLQALKDDGVIIWDDSDRQDYQDGYRFLEEKGFRKLEFVGFSPIYSLRNETGIFYRERNCFGI